MLDAAERIFERDGWREATLAAIGAAAGVSRGTPGYLFGSKAGLRSAMGARLVEAARGAASIESAGDPRNQISALLSGQLGVVAARPALSRLALEHWGAPAGSRSGDGGTGLAELERHLIRRIGELIEGVPARAAGPDAGGAAAALVVMVWSAGLPNVAGGCVAFAPAFMADRSALIASMVQKWFADSSLPASKSRQWRLPGVG